MAKKPKDKDKKSNIVSMADEVEQRKKEVPPEPIDTDEEEVFTVWLLYSKEAHYLHGIYTSSLHAAIALEKEEKQECRANADNTPYSIIEIVLNQASVMYLL